jgi:DNA mismatch repair protein MutL
MLGPPAKISLLPEHLIDQIKAGEVIERPGSLLKEIIENSIDAGSTKIELTVLNNGLDLISLKDNGRGIFSQDLPLAFSRHATSKINRFEDLYQLGSFGFRGEALASIAAISKIQCLSFNKEEIDGREIRLEGGLTVYENSRQKIQGQTGLELNIQELFYNTPVRLKFIQSHQSEKNYIKKIIYSFVLSHPQVEFILKLNDDEKIVYPSRPTLKERLIDIIPKSKELIGTTQRSYEQNEIEIFLAPAELKAPLKIQYTFINKRFVVDKQLLRVIAQTMATHFGHDDFHYVVFLNLPTDHIDVNVHPNKTIIKMFENSKVISLLSASIKEMASGPKDHVYSNNLNQSKTELSFQNPFTAMNEDLLLQERHEYNMDGIFSPHQNVTREETDLIWLNNFFILKMNQTWHAVSPGKLIDIYFSLQLRAPSSQSIPLLVSEPFKFLEDDLKRIHHLAESGIELEKLSNDTVVLRSIPEWLNGIPLQFVIEKMIKGQSFLNSNFDPRDWSKETWTKIIASISLSTLIEQKVFINLEILLSEKMK